MDDRRMNPNNTGRREAARLPVRSSDKRTATTDKRLINSHSGKGSSTGAMKRVHAPVEPASRRSASGIAGSVRRAVRGSFSSGKADDVRMKTVKSMKRKPFPITVILMALIVTGLFMFMIMSYVQINEYTLHVSELRSDLSELASERKDLAYQLDEKNDMLKIEKYAVDNLNMVKVDQLTKKHITIDREDKIEVVEPEPTEDSTVVTTMMSAFFSNFNGLWEYIN